MPFHCTVELDVKFVPLTVSENAAPPAFAKVGAMLLMVGDGRAAPMV